MNDRILWDIIDGLRDELSIAQDGITDLNDVVKDLQAEAIEQIKDNKRLQEDNNSFHGQYDEIQELKAENKRLNYKDGLFAENKKLKAECWCNGNNDVKAELNALRDQELDLIRDKDELQADNNTLMDDLEEEQNKVKKLKADNVRLVEQVSSINGNNSSTHTHTIKKEIAEYMSHNEGCGGARLFLIPRDAFNDRGECRNQDFYWDDGIE